MPRIIYGRVVVLLLLADEMLLELLTHEILVTYLADNRKARILLKDSTYIRAWQPLHGTRNRRPPTGAAAFNAQDFLINLAEGKSPVPLPAPLPARRRRLMVGKGR